MAPAARGRRTSASEAHLYAIIVSRLGACAHAQGCAAVGRRLCAEVFDLAAPLLLGALTLALPRRGDAAQEALRDRSISNAEACAKLQELLDARKELERGGTDLSQDERWNALLDDLDAMQDFADAIKERFTLVRRADGDGRGAEGGAFAGRGTAKRQAQGSERNAQA